MNFIGEMYNFSSKLWFNNRRIKKNGSASIYLQVIINGKHIEVPLKLMWQADCIDLANGVLKPRFKKDHEVNDYNLIIESERSKHTEIFRTYRLRKEDLDIAKFKREVSTFDQRECFLTYMDKEAKKRFSRKEIERKSYQNAMATIETIRKYDPICLFKNIDAKWMKGYKTYLLNHPYKTTTTWSRISYTKAYLRLASLEPMLYVNDQALNFSNPKPTYSTTFCDNDEIRRLMILHRTGGLTDVEMSVLSAFLFTCFTSLRISDLYRANYDWKVSDNILEFRPKKNFKKGKVLRIAIMPMANHFIQNFRGQFFTLPSEAEYNRTLKDLADKVSIHKRLTSHVGRHTYGYLYMTTIGNLKGLQEVLGHSKTETTERYAHLDEQYQHDAVKKIQDGFSDLILRKVKY